MRWSRPWQTAEPVRVQAAFLAWSLPADYGDGFVRQAAGLEDESLMVHSARGEQPDRLADSHTVEGVVKVVWHEASTHDSAMFTGRVEVTIVGARVVK